MTDPEPPPAIPANPYASPQAPLPQPVAPGEPSEAELMAFFGRNGRYYLERWRRWRSGGKDAGFNAAALLLAGFWLGYRKMYRVAALFLGAVLAESILEELIFTWWLGYDEPPAGLSGGTGIAFAVVCGLLGNRWYLSHAEREIARAKAEGLEGESLLRALAHRGQTSVPISLALFGAYLAAAFAIFSLLGIFLYSPA